MMLFHSVLVGFYIVVNLEMHCDVIVEPNHLKFNVFSEFYSVLFVIICLVF